MPSQTWLSSAVAFAGLSVRQSNLTIYLLSVAIFVPISTECDVCSKE
jgi:hypothetical protein